MQQRDKIHSCTYVSIQVLSRHAGIPGYYAYAGWITWNRWATVVYSSPLYFYTMVLCAIPGAVYYVPGVVCYVPGAVSDVPDASCSASSLMRST